MKGGTVAKWGENYLKSEDDQGKVIWIRGGWTGRWRRKEEQERNKQGMSCAQIRKLRVTNTAFKLAWLQAWSELGKIEEKNKGLISLFVHLDSISAGKSVQAVGERTKHFLIDTSFWEFIKSLFFLILLPCLELYKLYLLTDSTELCRKYFHDSDFCYLLL